MKLNIYIFLNLCFLILKTATCLKCDCNSFESAQDKIVDGEYAYENEFPWQVSLGLGWSINDNLNHICGGAILNENFVLTAAHCVQNINAGPPLFVSYGSNNLNKPRGRRQVIRYYYHHNYRPNDPNIKGDIAILELNKPIILNHFAKPACLFRHQSNINALINSGAESIASGWGSIVRTHKKPKETNLHGFEGTPYLKRVFLQTISPQINSWCAGRYDIICVDREIENDSVCNGDSGGPLHFVVNNKKIGVAGLTSYGQGDQIGSEIYYCDGKAAYTKIAFYNDYIHSIVNQNNICYVD